MNDYQARKAARIEAYKASAGKPQARRVFRVYATSILNQIPEQFSGRVIGAFASRADADAFAFGKHGTQHDISSYSGAPAFRALSSMLPRGTVCDACYTRFHVAAEEA